MATKLVCAVGIRDYDETNYRFRENEKRTKFAPIAVGCCALEREKDLELVALLTAEAEENGKRLEAEAENEGWTCTKVRIPAGKSEDELWRIFDAFGSRLEEGDELVFDLTYGFRHIPALLLSAAQYYTARKDLALLGIFYGALEASENGKTPIFDLTPLYDLSEWAYGVRLLRDYRFSAPLGEMLVRIQGRSYSDPRYRHRKFKQLQNVGKCLKELERPLVSGIALEAGFESHRALVSAQASEEELARIPPMEEPWRELKEQLESFSLQRPSVPKNEKKRKVNLTLEELQRQSRLIEGYLQSDNLWAAANLLREWTISAVIFHSGDTENWLSYDKRRKPVERKLGALSRWTQEENLKVALTAEQKKLVGHWQRITDRRNALAHAGMKEGKTDLKPGSFRQAFEELRAKLEDEEFWSVELAGKTEEVWLISPLGTTPGALFTAIKKARPDRLLIITSEQGKGLVPEILRQAEREDLSPHFVLLGDPFSGFSEVRDKKLAQGLRREYGLDWIGTRGKIFVNLTSDTTCLGWTVERLKYSLERMSLKPTTVACIDRRSPEEQRTNPYVEGEMINVENGEEE